MIFIDTSEYRESSTMPRIQDSVVLDELESITGADMMISPLHMPAANRTLIVLHIESGAILVQVKRGMDLPSSVGERLVASLVKMREIAPRQAQRVLLFTGILTCEKDGRAEIDGRRVSDNIAGANYWACQSSLEAWCERGGTVYTLSRVSLLPEWAKRKEARLKDYLENPVKRFFPQPPEMWPEENEDDPLQTPQMIRDGRILLATLPGIGTEKANEVWRWAGASTIWSLIGLTDLETLKLETRPKGIGSKTINAVRRHLSLKEGERIILHSVEEESNDDNATDATDAQ